MAHCFIRCVAWEVVLALTSRVAMLSVSQIGTTEEMRHNAFISADVQGMFWCATHTEGCTVRTRLSLHIVTVCSALV